MKLMVSGAAKSGLAITPERYIRMLCVRAGRSKPAVGGDETA